MDKKKGNSRIFSEKEQAEELDELETFLEEKMLCLNRLTYEQMKEKRANPKLEELRSHLSSKLQDPDLFLKLESYQEKFAHPRLQRRIQCWIRFLSREKIEGNTEVIQLKGEISNSIMAYPYPVGDEIAGDIGQIRHLLRTEEDEKIRYLAWSSVQALALELEDKMTALHHLRNHLAQEEGSENYPAFVLELEGIPLKRCKGLLFELLEKTKKPYRELLHERGDRKGLDSIKPWDLQYLLDGGMDIPERLFPQEKMTESLESFLNLYRFSLDGLGIVPQYFDIPWNGLTITVNHRRDTRIICNVRDGFGYYSIMFHELGHALHKIFNQQEEFIFTQETRFSSEGIAETFGSFTRYPQWLQDMGVSEEELGEVSSALLAPWLYFIRQRTTLGLFGFSIYETPDQDLHQLLGKMEAEYTGVDLDITPRWTANPWFCNGLNWHVYIIGAMMASQIHHGLQEKFGTVYGNREAMDYLIQSYLAPGTTVDWLERIETITGRGLDAHSLIKEVKKRARDSGLC